MLMSRILLLTEAYEHYQMLLCEAIVRGCSAQVRHLCGVCNHLEEELYDCLVRLVGTQNQEP